MRFPAPLKRLLVLHRPYIGRLLLAVLAMAVTAAVEPAIPFLIQLLLDHGFKEGADFPYWIVPAIVITLFMIRGIATFTSTFMMSWVTSRLLTVLRGKMFDRLLDVSSGFFESYSMGRSLNTIMYEVQQIVDMITNVMVSMIRASLTVIGLLVWMFYLNWKLSLVTLLLIPTMTVIVRFTGQRLKRLNQTTLALNANLTEDIEETTRALQVIKVFGSQRFERTRFKQKIEEIRRQTLRITRTFASTVPVTQLFTAIAGAMVVVFALYQFRHGQLSIGGFVSFLTAMLMLLDPLKKLAEVNGPLQRGMAAAEEVFRLIDAPVERTSGKELTEKVKGQVDFENVSFTYPGATKPALQNINLHVKPGETIALVGMSGGGKTTFINLLPEFFIPAKGRILLDGLPVSEISLKSLREQMAMVSQHVVLFNGTISANVAYGDSDPDEKRIRSAIKAAHLSNVVADLDNGLDTVIGHNGSRLSGGQRQRLAIARAIYKDAPVLILDEATSALDTESEREVQAALDELMKGRTTFVIAHRLSTIEHASRIVVLSEGIIEEVGTHKELLEKEGVYANLYHLQFSKEERKH